MAQRNNSHTTTILNKDDTNIMTIPANDTNNSKAQSKPNTSRTNKHAAPSTNNIRIATINVRTLQDDMKLASIIKSAHRLGIDILSMQEVRRTGNGVFMFMIYHWKGWQLIWSGHKRKREHGVGILIAPHVELDEHTEHLQAWVISATLVVKGMRLAILNVYSPTDCTKSDAAKSQFYSALNKAKAQLNQTPSYKLITLGDWNATISAQSKSSGAWDS